MDPNASPDPVPDNMDEMVESLLEADRDESGSETPAPSAAAPAKTPPPVPPSDAPQDVADGDSRETPAATAAPEEPEALPDMDETLIAKAEKDYGLPPDVARSFLNNDSLKVWMHEQKQFRAPAPPPPEEKAPPPEPSMPPAPQRKPPPAKAPPEEDNLRLDIDALGLDPDDPLTKALAHIQAEIKTRQTQFAGVLESALEEARQIRAENKELRARFDQEDQQRVNARYQEFLIDFENRLSTFGQGTEELFGTEPPKKGSKELANRAKVLRHLDALSTIAQEDGERLEMNELIQRAVASAFPQVLRRFAEKQIAERLKAGAAGAVTRPRQQAKGLDKSAPPTTKTEIEGVDLSAVLTDEDLEALS